MKQWFRGFLVSTFVVLLTACGGGGGGTTADTTAPVITLSGEKNITLNVGDTYTEAGATATDNVDGTVAVTITGSVDTTKEGTYTITYTATDKAGNKSTKTRTVTVSAVVVPDTTPPAIILSGNATLTLNVGDTYTEAGATATDNVDGTVAVTITGSVDTTKEGTYTITYTATDKAGNKSTKTRTVTVSAVVVPDTVAPVITLSGEASITLNVGDTYTEAGATATDNVDGTVAVTTTGSVDTTKEGTYTITYTAIDSSDNEVKATRTVTVTVVAPTISAKLKKTGQTKSYDKNGYEVTDGSIKDDGYYQAGVAPSYTRDDVKEIVTDHVTGLMWQDNAEVISVTKPWVTRDNYNAGKYLDTSGDTAATYCSNLTLGGFNDWRLPMIKELEGIVDYSRGLPAINPVFFYTVSTGSYWSSTTDINIFENFTIKSSAWYVYFGNGGGNTSTKDYSNNIRCIR